MPVVQNSIVPGNTLKGVTTGFLTLHCIPISLDIQSLRLLFLHLAAQCQCSFQPCLFCFQSGNIFCQRFIQRQGAVQNLPDDFYRKSKLAQKQHSLQPFDILLRILTVACCCAAGGEKPLLFVKADVGFGNIQQIFDLVDLHTVVPLFLYSIKNIKDKQG